MATITLDKQLDSEQFLLIPRVPIFREHYLRLPDGRTVYFDRVKLAADCGRSTWVSRISLDRFVISGPNYCVLTQVDTCFAHGRLGLGGAIWVFGGIPWMAVDIPVPGVAIKRAA